MGFGSSISFFLIYMLKKLQQIDKNKKLIRYRFNLKHLNIKYDCYDCYDCQFSAICLYELIPGKFITLYDLCYQLKKGKHMLIYVSKNGLESIKNFCR